MKKITISSFFLLTILGLSSFCIGIKNDDSYIINATATKLIITAYKSLKDARNDIENKKNIGNTINLARSIRIKEITKAGYIKIRHKESKIEHALDSLGLQPSKTGYCLKIAPEDRIADSIYIEGFGKNNKYSTSVRIECNDHESLRAVCLLNWTWNPN